MEYSVLINSALYLFIPAAFASTRTLTYKDDVCYGYFETNRKQNYKVIYAGERMGSICKDMSFNGWDGDKGASYESCVTITKFDLRSCNLKLEYRVNTNRGSPSKSYGCYSSVSSIPKFCTEGILYIRITAKEKNPSSVEYTISSGAEDVIGRDSISATTTIVAAAVGVGVMIFISVILVICIRRKRAAALAQQSQCPAVTYTTQPGIQQSTSTQHQQAYMYTPVNQAIVPTPGTNPQQRSGYYPQQTNYTPQSATPASYPQSYQQQSAYLQPSQPHADSRVQQYQPDINPSAPPMFSSSDRYTQQNDSFSPPPSYEEVQKQKL